MYKNFSNCQVAEQRRKLKALFITLRAQLFIGLSLISIISGCKTITNPDNCSCSCLPPQRGSFGVRLPSLAHLGQRLSPDGKILAFIFGDGTSHIGLFDMSSLKITYVNLVDILPNYPNGGSNCSRLMWSPYSSDRLYLECFEYYNTAGSTIYAQNAYIYDLSKKRARRITPSIFGKYGPDANFGFSSWLKGSSITADSLTLDSVIYVPQSDTFYPLPQSYREVISQSPKTEDFFLYRRDSIKGNPPLMYIDENRFYLGDHLYGKIDSHWSPSGDKIVLSGTTDFPSTNPNDPYTYNEVWVIDIKTFNQMPNNYLSLTRLDFQSLFCTYSFLGIDPEFLTDTTLAVSMCKDGDDFCPIWEITTKGKLIRQLTYK